jgi:hypothetical protein
MAAPGSTVPAGTTHTSTTTSSGNVAAHDTAKGIKGVFAAVHGAGETLRGTVNSAVDETFGDVSALYLINLPHSITSVR